jgi:hypothetical protein
MEIAGLLAVGEVANILMLHRECLSHQFALSFDKQRVQAQDIIDFDAREHALRSAGAFHKRGPSSGEGPSGTTA